MRFVILFCVVAAATIASGAEPVRGDHVPAFVVPGRPFVPVIINGRNASYTLVEGDWGLHRPGAVPPTVIGHPYAPPLPSTGRYFPATGHKPRVGRYEIEPPPNRALPPPAESYRREWGVQSQPGPVTEYPPFDPPPVIMAPNVNRRGPAAPYHKAP
jgi:hypothetical protein